MILVIQNNQLTSVVLNAELGYVPPRRTISIQVTIAQLEKIRPTLVRLAENGAIVWATSKNPDSTDDGAEGATVSYVDGSGAGGFVSGPISSTNNAIPRYDGTLGTDLKNSSVIVADDGTIQTPGNILVSGTVDGRDVASDGTKLDTIESNADVTDTTNVDAAGAVMDTDFSGSYTGLLRRLGAGAYSVLKDNLTAVIAPTVSDDSASDYTVGSIWVDVSLDNIYMCADATPGSAVWRLLNGGGGGVTDHGALTGLADDDHTQYLLASGTRAMTGSLDMGTFSITNVGNVDGRDISADGTKLDGIEALADVTDTTNVAAAGAVMESDYTPAYSILAQQVGTGSPSSVAVGTNTILGRTTGDIDDLTPSQVKTLLATTAAEVAFTPDGDISATNAQTAIVEVRNDTDTKLGTKVQIGGQLGGTISSPTVVAITETSGPTGLTIGAIADGEFLVRSGGTVVGAPGGGGSGDVVGPASATDNAIARFDLTTGKLIQNSTVTISDTGSITLPGGETVDGRDVSVDGSKLDGIEALADVTDAANVAAAGAVMDSDFAGSTTGDMIRTGVGAYAVLQHNLGSVVAPTVTDDNTTGYAVGSRWIDTVANQVYFCADASTGAAVWRQVGAGGGVTDHGLLTGLADDDHTQYLLVAGTRAMTGSLDMGTFAITNVGNVDGRDVSADGAALDAHIAAANPHSGSLSTAHEGAGGAVHANVVAAGAAGFMTGADKTKLDGIATGATATPLTAAAPADIGVTAVGVSTEASRADHVHAHGNQAGGSLHADVIAAGASGFMTGADKTKLDGIEALADVTDATNVAAAGAVMDSDFGGSSIGDLIRTGVGTYAVLQHNLGSVVAPAVTDDNTAGYVIGSRWIDTAADQVYTCTDASTGAAVWVTGGSGVTSVNGDVGPAVTLVAGDIGFTPNGDIAATDTQAAIVEVRDDTDTKLSTKASIAGQLGGTGASPTVLGARETSGPTLLTYGAIADGDYLFRSGTTIIGGTPAGGGGGPTIETVEGFSLTNEYRTAVGALPGASAFSAVWYGFYGGPISGVPVGAGQFLIGSTAGTSGWGLAAGGQGGSGLIGFDCFVHDGAGNFLNASQVADPNVFSLAMRALHIAITYDGTSLILYVNGSRGSVIGTAASAGYTADASARFRVCNGGLFGDEPATACGFAGAGYATSTLTEAQLREHMQNCRDAANSFVAGSITWANRYDIQNPGVSFPGTVDDLVSTDDLTLVGTLSSRTRSLL